MRAIDAEIGLQIDLRECDVGTLGFEPASLVPFAQALGPLAIVDLETTGLAQDSESELLEFGALLLDAGGEKARSAHVLVRPERPLPPFVTRLTGLSDADVAAAPAIARLAPALAGLLRGHTLIAHNADFEQHFLARCVAPEFERANFLDTLDLLALTHPDAPDLRLESFTRILLGREERHRALDDALDTARILARVAAGAAAAEARYVHARAALASYAADSPWLHLLAAAKTALPAPAAHFLAVGETREPRVPFTEEAIVSALADEARGRRYFPDYRVRREQIELARRCVRTLPAGVALLEGGTGVGKSLAYLAAAIPFAVSVREGSENVPVVISTRTKLLQDQLTEKDIPAAARFLGYPELRALSMKGRANYVCEARLQFVLGEGREPTLFPEERLAYAALWTCARTRPDGEVGTLPAALLRRYPKLFELRRRAVAARAEHCPREQCAHYRDCAFGARRAALAGAHLVVANHDLLLRWPPDYPALRYVIADEVHDLASVADEVYAEEIRPGDLLDRFDELFGRPAGRAQAPPLLPARVRRQLGADAAHWRRDLQQELAALGRSVGEAAPFFDLEVENLDKALREQVATLARSAADRLDFAAIATERALETRPAGEAGLEANAQEPKPAALRNLAELRAAARILRRAFEPTAEEVVAAFEGLEAPYDRWRLVVRPVAPAAIFHEAFFSRLTSFAGVSASVFVGGDEFAALGELELASRAGDGVERVALASPFPYADQMRVLALKGVRDPIACTLDVLAALALRLRGSTLGLFTNVQRMQQVASDLAVRLQPEGIEVLVPRRASDDPAALVERFQRGGTVLLGARRFWQGLDLPGDALRAIVIEKLPFERPTQLFRRRCARLEADGIDAFDRYQVGKMLLYLKQMVGRLIRTERDRGVVVIVDARSDRGYFQRLREALPAGTPLEVGTPADVERLLAEVGISGSTTP